MRVQVHKCRVTGKLFEYKDRAKYIAHLKKIRESQQIEREYSIARKTFAGWIAKEKENITHVDMIAPWILKNQIQLMTFYNSMHVGRDKFHPKTDRYTKLSLSVNYSPCVSNSHTCPHNGVQNWCNTHKDRPSGYPGFCGNVEGSLSRKDKNVYGYPNSEFLNLIGIGTLSGGGGNDSWSYGVTIFLDDWPGLKQQVVFNKLVG